MLGYNTIITMEKLHTRSIVMDTNQKIKNMVQLAKTAVSNQNQDILKHLCEILETDFKSSRKLASSIILHLLDNGCQFPDNKFVKEMVGELSSTDHLDLIKLRSINTKLF